MPLKLRPQSLQSQIVNYRGKISLWNKLHNYKLTCPYLNTIKNEFHYLKIITVPLYVFLA